MIFIDNLNIFSSLVKDKKYKCPYCAKIFKESEQLFFHVQTSHSDEIPSGYTPRHAVYDKTHPGDHLCQICKLNKCMWNEKTGRYSTICENPSCREEARRRFKENYKKKNGKDHSINDPEIQKEMMKRRKTSGVYKFQDGTVLPYISSFERDFLEFCDLTLNLTTKDLIECPFVFYYEYEGEKHFYLPDFYLKPYDLIIEIKADEDISHPKILAIDKEKEVLKDEAIKKDGNHNYIKICDKNYDAFLDLFNLLKNDTNAQKPTKDKIIIIPERKEEIRGFKMPDLNFIGNLKNTYSPFIMRKILDDSEGKLNLSLVSEEDAIKLNGMKCDFSGITVLKEYLCDFSDENNIKNTLNKFSKYYTKQNEHLINQDLLGIRMDLSKHSNWFIFRVKNISKEAQKKLISLLDYYCINNDINLYSFISTYNGFVLLANIQNTSDEYKELEKFCTKTGQKHEYSCNFDFEKSSVPLIGAIDFGVEVKIIK